MADHVLLADSLFAKALREPNLLAPGSRPSDNVKVNRNHFLGKHVACLFLGGVQYDIGNGGQLTAVDAYQYAGNWRFPAFGDYVLGDINGVSASGLTVAVKGVSNYTADASHRRIFVLSDQSNANRRISVAFNNLSGTPVVRLNDHDGTTNAILDIPSSAAQSTAPFLIGAIERWGGGRYITSKKTTVGTASEAVVLSSANVGLFDKKCIGGWYKSGALTGGQEWKGDLELAVVFDIDIGEDVLNQYLEYPYQIFKPANDVPFLFPVATGAYTLTADAGSYATTGVSASLVAARKISGAAGSYTIAGQSAGLNKGFSLIAAAGSYAITGQPAGVTATRALQGDAGAYTISGQSAGLKAARVIACATGSYSLTGVAATLTYTPAGAYVLTCEAGSYVLSGQDASLISTAVESGAREVLVVAAEGRILYVDTDKTILKVLH